MNFLVRVFFVVLCTSGIADAQDDPRWVAFGDAGYARIWDDEGFLGDGLGLNGGVGYRIASGTTIQFLVGRMPYYRDVEYLTFDGRVVFAGVEAAFQSRRPSVRPFVTVGAGVFDDDGVWIQKTIVNPSLPRLETRVPRNYTLAAMTASGGLDFRLSSRTSIRAGLRFYGLLDTGDDLAPHIVLQPGVGMAWRW